MNVSNLRVLAGLVSYLMIDTVASLDNSTHSFPEAPIPFRTFPDPRMHSHRRFRFIASSCLSPNYPYRGHFHKNTIRGFDLLADYLAQSSDSIAVNQPNTTATENPSTDFLLLLGDFIYADVPVFIGDDKASYRRLYRRNFKSPSFRRVYEKLRRSRVCCHSFLSNAKNAAVIHIYDDHEVTTHLACLKLVSLTPTYRSSIITQEIPSMLTHT